MADDSTSDLRPDALGPNAWLVDEMHEQYLADPTSVSESWRDFFADYKRDAEPQAPSATQATVAPPAPAAPATNGAPASAAVVAAPAAAPTTPAASTPVEPDGEPIRGAAARIVANMEASLSVPTATSFRIVPAKLLEVNRKVINGYLGRTRGGKISFTHIIGFAVVRAIHDAVPRMNASYR
jgi:pyruvate/2-oxoglutarate dehydrogenase complex dihydrolipoamide acyltransferase (E2) component